MLARDYFPHFFGAASLLVIFGAASVHPQSAPPNAVGATKSYGSTVQGTFGTDPFTSGDKAAPTGPMSKSDRDLMREMGYANITAIEAAKMAQGKSKDQRIQQFAQQIIDDHTKAQGQLQSLAQDKGVGLPSSPDKKRQDMMKKLGSLSGAAFDHAYMAQFGAGEEQGARAAIVQAQTRATDPDLKALAGKFLPTVDQHRQMAQDMRSNKTPTVASGVSGTEGTSGGSAK